MPAAKSFLLGAPLSEEGISVAIREKHEDLKRLVSKLKIIENHQAFILLKNSFALLKQQYILRASPAYSHMENLERFDDALVAALTAVTNIRFGENSLTQVALPVSLEGLEIRMAKNIALPAFISFLHAARELVDGIFINILLPESNGLTAAEREGVVGA